MAVFAVTTVPSMVILQPHRRIPTDFAVFFCLGTRPAGVEQTEWQPRTELARGREVRWLLTARKRFGLYFII